MRRVAFALVALEQLLLPGIASAHGVQGRAETPVPLSVFFYAAAAVVIVSFVALGVAWSKPRWVNPGWHPAPAWLNRLVLGTETIWILRSLLLAGFVLVLAAAALGSQTLNSNIAPVTIFVVWWVGLVPLSVLFGNVWRELNPWVTVARILRIGDKGKRPYPPSWGLWPAAVLLIVVAWLELVYPTAASVRLIAALMIGYSAFTLLGMARYGTRAWLDNAEVFSVYTGMLATLSPVEVRTHGADGRRLGFRAPIVGSTKLRPRAGLVAFVGVLVGSVSSDGFSGTDVWTARDVAATERMITTGLDEFAAGIVVATIGMLVVMGVVIAAFEFAAFVADRSAGLSREMSVGRVAGAFAHSLIPIAVGYNVAHYFTLFVFQSQDLVRLASDPFDTGADYFGTVDHQIDFQLVSPNAIWAVQVGAIVIAHVLGLMLAHDRALELANHSRHAVRSQYPMLVLMVLLTVSGLWFLSEGMNG